MTGTDMKLQKFTSSDSINWDQMGESQIFIGDVVDLSTEPDAKMTVGFARLAMGEELSNAFPYDEVLVITRGVATLRAAPDITVTAYVGEFIYMPANTPITVRADKDTEMVYVANPPDVYAAWVAAAAQ